MTRKERKLRKDAIAYIERLDDEYGDDERLSNACQYALKVLKQPSLFDVLDRLSSEINTPNRGTCDYFIIERIEQIIDEYRRGDAK